MQHSANSACSDDDLLDFIGLTSEKKLKELQDFPSSIFAWLSAVFAKKGRAPAEDLDTWLEQRRAKHRSTVFKHRVFKKLNASEHFRCAFETFKRNMTRRGAQAASGQRGDEFAEMRFLNIVAIYAWDYILGNQGAPLPKANRRTVKQASDHLKKLRGLLNAGIRLPNWSDQAALMQGITALEQHLEWQIVSRKRPGNKATSEARWVESLSRRFRSELGDTSPKINMDLANMMEYDIDRSTVERHTRATRPVPLKSA